MTAAPGVVQPPPSPPFAVDRLVHAPLLPVAIGLTLGVILDRYFVVPFGLALLLAVACVVAWVFTAKPDLARACLWATCVALGAAYHHQERQHFAPDDVGNIAARVPRWVRLRGTLIDEPYISVRAKNDPLIAFHNADPTYFVLRVESLQIDATWQPLSGRARVRLNGAFTELQAGDEIEIAGELAAPAGPSNPGELDYRARLLDQRIRATLFVDDPGTSVVRLRLGWTGTLAGWLGRARGYAQRVLAGSLPPERAGLAIALLLGDGGPMSRAEWDRYVRTGVVHVLAISGQHLVILAGFAWAVLPLLGLSRRKCAILIALLTIAYALLTGGRPSAMRAAVMVTAISTAILLRRDVMSANVFALTWIVVLILDPTDLFTAGFQLSFLCVAVLAGGIGRWLDPGPRDPLDQLVDESRPPWLRAIRGGVRWLGRMYLTTLILTVVAAPLVCSWTHIVSPIAIVIAPPLIILTTVALVAGFGLLLLHAVLAWPFAFAVDACLWSCDALIEFADALPFGHAYLAAPPVWWMTVFYAWVIALMVLPLDSPSLARVVATGAAAAFLLLLIPTPTARDELRVTFLAVGHGCAVVVETPDGRTILYDAGAIAGPDLTPRILAPFLWHRGVRRIDEVILSHADLDHINGLPKLLERFAVGQVTTTPTFAGRLTPGASNVIDALMRERVGVRSAKAGDVLRFGAVTMTALHPPVGMERGSENARSLVLLVEHLGHRVLLTGDLAEEGLGMVMRTAISPIDVLMSPHHGSKSSNTPEFAAWAAARLVVSSQSKPRGRGVDAYGEMWTTHDDGAVTIVSHATGLVAESFATGRRVVLRVGGR